jgi:tRNA(Ile)-lysidine synthase
MSIKNMKGHKKIKDIFINEKINMTDRIGYPVVVDSNDEIIWLPGIKKSSFDGKKEGKYDIILEYH